MEKKFWTIHPVGGCNDYDIYGNCIRKRANYGTQYTTYDAAVEEAKKSVQKGGDYLIMEVVAAVKQPIPPAEVVAITA